MPVALQSRQSHAHLSWFLFVHTFLSFRRINKRGRGELAVDAGAEPWRLAHQSPLGDKAGAISQKPVWIVSARSLRLPPAEERALGLGECLVNSRGRDLASFHAARNGANGRIAHKA